jgi:hypothetical protein
VNKKLPLYFGLWFVGFVIVLALVFPENRPVDFKVPQFRTSQADLLYFKNIRSFYYDKVVEEKSGYDILHLKTLWQDSIKSPQLTFAILNNWRQDETYVITEWKRKMLFQEPLAIQWKNEKEQGVISIKEFNNEAHFKFAGEVYSHLINEDELLIDGESIYSDIQRKSAIKTLKDYFKLVGKIY